MGTLDKILAGLGAAAVGFLTGGPVGAVAGALGGISAEDEAQKQIAGPMKLSPTSLTGASKQLLAETQPGTISKVLSTLALGPLPLGLLAAQESAERAAGVPGGAVSGKNRIITTVSTINPAGQVVKQKNLEGSPFLMNKDLVTAKRVFRTIAKASGRMPRKTVKEGAVTQLKNAVVDKALANVLTENGNGGKC